MTDPLALPGLVGANPLGYLAALGVLSLCDRAHPGTRMSWSVSGGGYSPYIFSSIETEDELVALLEQALRDRSNLPFALESRLPFAADTLRNATIQAVGTARPESRHALDLFAALGTDILIDDKGNFADTAFRMVRSGDSNGQGLTAYAMTIRENTDEDALRRTLFQTWDYRDDGSSLRWDPMEDQRYALRWHDPSPESNKKFSVRSMRGANALALHGISLMPVQPIAERAATTGFSSLKRRREVFTWPIWDKALPIDVVRSVVALGELHQSVPPRQELRARGILEIYRSERIAPNQYYKNFSPAITP